MPCAAAHAATLSSPEDPPTNEDTAEPVAVSWPSWLALKAPSRCHLGRRFSAFHPVRGSSLFQAPKWRVSLLLSQATCQLRGPLGDIAPSTLIPKSNSFFQRNRAAKSRLVAVTMPCRNGGGHNSGAFRYPVSITIPVRSTCQRNWRRTLSSPAPAWLSRCSRKQVQNRSKTCARTILKSVFSIDCGEIGAKMTVFMILIS